MPEALLIFTFSPIQSFIGEARRTADLYVGSRILVELANAVRVTLPNEAWIYPSPEAKNDSPNVLVARVQVASVESLTQAEGPVKRMEEALTARWKTIALNTKERLASTGLPAHDSKWQEIWNRQSDFHWETAWAAAWLNGRPYADTYQEARITLEAVRRARPFAPADEDGLKDSLSGARSALRTEENDAAAYGEQLNRHFGAGRIRKNERLDTLGAVKRFSDLAESTRFPSTSDVAAANYIQRARQQAPKALRDYQEAIRVVLDLPKSNTGDWPTNYDGDLLYLDTLTPKRLEREYGLAFESEENQGRRDLLKRAKEKLLALYQTKIAEEESLGAPSAYYAILVLDGDNMGEMVSTCREAQDHKSFSQSLTAFASQVRPEAEKFLAQIVYNGGDDVLAFAPLAMAVPFAQRLAQVFAETVKAQDRSGTLSGGIAIVHHNHPLGSALRATRLAERQAKKVRGKAAVCVRVLRRGGEPVEVCSSWEALGNLLADSVKHFEQHLSSRFAYSVAEKAEVGRGLEAEARRALLHYFVQRHANESANGQLQDYAQQLTAWSVALDDLLPAEVGVPVGLREVSGWVRLARFLSQKGGEAA